MGQRQDADRKQQLAREGQERVRRCPDCNAIIDGDECWRCTPEEQGSETSDGR